MDLFDLSWELHCPRCNMLSERFDSVAHAHKLSSCPMCEFSFGVDRSERMEVIFTLNRAIEDLGFPPLCFPSAVLQPVGNLACPNGQTVSTVEQLEPGQYRYVWKCCTIRSISVSLAIRSCRPASGCKYRR